MKDTTFANTYKAENIWRFSVNEEDCIVGPSPTLKTCLENGHFEDLRKIILDLIDILSNFTSAKYKFTSYQREQLGNLIITLNPHLKVKMLHHFFALAMSGAYGKFYDKLEPMDITSALRTYIHETVPHIYEKYYYKGTKIN